MNECIEMRRCDANDVNSLKQLWPLCFSDDTRDDIDTFFDKNFPLSMAFAGFHGDDAVVMLYLLPAVVRGRDVHVPVWYLYAGGTHPAYRSRGLYRRLMSVAYDWALESVGNAIYLHPANEDLFSLYSSLGYVNGLVSSRTECAPFAAEPLTLDAYFENRNEMPDGVLAWEPIDPVTRSFWKGGWSASIDNNGTMYLMEGETVIERMPLSVNDTNSVTTALWIPTTDDEAMIKRLTSSIGYSIVYGD